LTITPRVVCSDDVCCLALWQNVAITDVAGNMDVARMKLLGKTYRELASAHPGGILTFAIIRPGVPVSSSEARDEAAKFITTLGPSILRMGMLIEDTGVMAQVLRTIIRGLNVVTRNTKLVLYNNLDEAVRALAPLTVATSPGADARSDLAAAIASVRRGYAPHAPQRVAQR
jgi:hypothetical protein